jgi:2-C-methyl-D-erythritol 2,4-cyclodiphosphate synthase
MNSVTDIRIGIGFDVHAFAENRKLIIGGIEIPYEKGLLGHSDADVLLHAICDALLGALALGDIGQHFPDKGPLYKDANSKDLLIEVFNMISKNGYQVQNIDSVVTCEKPKLSPYISLMRKKISEILNIYPDQLSIKATTTERLGFVGREEGISAFASVLLIKK